MNLAAGTASGADSGSDTLISIENITGRSGNDTLTNVAPDLYPVATRVWRLLTSCTDRATGQGAGPFFSPLAGLIADRMNQKLFQILCLGTMTVAGLLIFDVADTPFEHEALSLLFGVSGGFAYVNGYSLAQRSVKGAMIARVSGYYFAASTLPAAISGYVLAVLVDALGWPVGASTMILAFLIVPIAVSLLIDTRSIAGKGRRRTSGARLFT